MKANQTKFLLLIVYSKFYKKSVSLSPNPKFKISEIFDPIRTSPSQNRNGFLTKLLCIGQFKKKSEFLIGNWWHHVMNYIQNIK